MLKEDKLFSVLAPPTVLILKTKLLGLAPGEN
jgi:hypothetical protein